jgi:hypothetical protein
MPYILNIDLLKIMVSIVLHMDINNNSSNREGFNQDSQTSILEDQIQDSQLREININFNIRPNYVTTLNREMNVNMMKNVNLLMVKANLEP